MAHLSLGTPELPEYLEESRKYHCNDLIVNLISQFWIARPPAAEIAKGLVFPWCEDCDSSVALQAIGIIGATITPHNLYLHSGLVKVSTCFQNQHYMQSFNLKLMLEFGMGLKSWRVMYSNSKEISCVKITQLDLISIIYPI